MKYLLTLVFIVFASMQSFANCEVKNSAGNLVEHQGDALFQTITKNDSCPQNVFELKEQLKISDLKSKPGMVANRGRNNPSRGSFSFFEVTTGSNVQDGDFFFGHFTFAHKGQIHLDQAPRNGALMIELIAWDPEKGFYNFYELIGGTVPTWFYRGDTVDILADNQFLHRKDSSFGRRLRCSACHTSGGPIMKEIAAPHNDWWRINRTLPFAPNSPAPELKVWLADLMDAADFATSVKRGIQKLEHSPQYRALKQSASLQERLRPLFCAVEINLESDLIADDDKIEIPSAFFVNPLLGDLKLVADRSFYEKKLKANKLRFPETNHLDADHGWLTPVKSYSDLLAIESLVSEQLIDTEFVADVLSVDFKNPVFSKKRCGLLGLVPEPNESIDDWKSLFIENLSKNNSPEAQTLLKNLTDPKRNIESHKNEIANYSGQLLFELNRDRDFGNWVKRLIRLRSDVFQHPISQNPMGQILEPGFRVIFPVER